MTVFAGRAGGPEGEHAAARSAKATMSRVWSFMGVS
jgi:hypothetical protein